MVKPNGFEPKRWILVVSAIGTAAGVLTVGLGAAAANGRGGHDLAVGSARAPFPTAAGPGFVRLSVSAHSDSSGLHPRGHVRAHGTLGSPMGEFKVAGPVTCLRVEGNKAAIKYRFNQASGSAAAFKGGGVEIFVEVNGPPRHGHPVDEVADQPPQTAAVFDATATQCDDPTTANYEKVTSGNYTVRDRDPGTAVGGRP